jgi:hypothetical protein
MEGCGQKGLHLAVIPGPPGTSLGRHCGVFLTTLGFRCRVVCARVSVLTEGTTRRWWLGPTCNFFFFFFKARLEGCAPGWGSESSPKSCGHPLHVGNSMFSRTLPPDVLAEIDYRHHCPVGGLGGLQGLGCPAFWSGFIPTTLVHAMVVWDSC